MSEKGSEGVKNNKEIVIHKEGGSMTQFQCPMLNATNYTIWSIRIKTILKANGLWDMIEPSANTQTDEKKDMTATAYLFQALPEEMIIQIANCKSAKKIWDALKTRNVGVDRVQKARLQTLKTEFEMLKMEEDSIDSFTAKLNGIVTKASNLGTIYDQPTLVRKLLSSVPKKFVQIAATIEQFTDLEVTTLDEIIGRLKAFEERTSLLNEDSENNQGKLLFSQYDNKSSQGRRFERRRFNSSQRNKGNFRQEEENESQINFRKNNSDDVERKRNSRNQNKVEFDINKVRCYNCNNFGHYASDCRKSNHGGKQANLVQEEQEDDEPTLLMLQIDDSDTQKIYEDIEEYVHVKEDRNKKDKIQFPKIGGGDYLMFDVLEVVGSVQVDDVVPGQDVGHGGVHEHDDDDLEENEYGEGDLQIDHLDQLADDTFDNGVPADRSGEVIANVAEGDAEDIDRVVFAAH
ncbi:hypothetical protein E3N88_45805 [Mikania micrantha]|uniref:CCHC-type domain-containing protein n=1 Tax=Mikania micrantha TaxID=192012 RepID=A0A5N6L8B8_9ASTR|nr:hypothetical protein E3N88_45805 [Mikania micrantha]